MRGGAGRVRTPENCPIIRAGPAGGDAVCSGPANKYYEAGIMSETYVLGIDAGGTHTDAVLLACDAAAEEQAPGEICADGVCAVPNNS